MKDKYEIIFQTDTEVIVKTIQFNCETLMKQDNIAGQTTIIPKTNCDRQVLAVFDKTKTVVKVF